MCVIILVQHSASSNALTFMYRLDTRTAPSINELWKMLPGNDDAPVDDDLPRCTTLGCRYYGMIEYAGRCYQCHKNQSTTTTIPGSPQTRLLTGWSIRVIG